MSTYGIKASKVGVDVTTAAEKDLVLSTDSMNMKNSSSTNVYLTLLDTASTTVNIAHDLSYTPSFRAFFTTYSYDTGLTEEPWREAIEGSEFLGGLSDIYTVSSADDTNISIFVSNISGMTKHIAIKVLMFIERLE